jgi:uncharacterized protein (TIGR03382 family)
MQSIRTTRSIRDLNCSRFALALVVALALPSGVLRAEILRALSPANPAAAVTAQSIDAGGNIVGLTTLSFDQTPVIWRPGAYTVQALPFPTGMTSGGANAITSTGGLIAGYAQPADQSSAVALLWTSAAGGTFAAAPLPGPTGAVTTSAYALNPAGIVAGYATDSSDVTRAVVWSPGAGGAYSSTVLPTVAAGQFESGATAVNSLGQVAGYALTQQFSNVTNVSAVWQPGAGGAYTAKTVIAADSFFVTSMNDYGTGTGVYAGGQPGVMVQFEGDYYAFVLDIPFGTTHGSSNAVNGNDYIVGSLTDPTTPQTGDEAALWIPTETQWDLLNLDEWFHQNGGVLASRWVLSEATGITDDGLIVGNGLFDDDGIPTTLPLERGFVLDASSLVPEPSAASLAMVLLGALLRRRRISSDNRMPARSHPALAAPLN